MDQEKYKVSARRSWRKAHFGIDENHYIQAAVITDRFIHDESPVYDKLSAHSPSSNIVIPPAKNAVVNSKAHK